MFCLAYDAALRREEVCSLLLSDFDFANRLVTVRAMVAKGRRQRVVPYSQVSAALMTHYLKHRRERSVHPGAAFLSESRRNHAQPLTIWT
jgi:integrase